MGKALKLLKEEQWSPTSDLRSLALKGLKISHERIYREIQ